MPSISTSEAAPLLEVDRVNLVFHADVHRNPSLRDLFTRALRDPVGTFLAERDRLHVLRDVSLRVSRGDRVALLGVNGTGKTSLCRCIAGIYRPTSGSVRFAGSLRAVFDTSVGILPELTGRENAYLLAEFMYPDVPELHEELVRDALEFSELGKFCDVPYRVYSNGMQARLNLSMISGRPCDLLILDEVFDGADQFFRDKIAARIVDMIERSGAVIFVSHSVGQIERVCNRLVLLHQGSVVHDGDVAAGLRMYQALNSEATA